jgi:hypothetical protein
VDGHAPPRLSAAAAAVAVAVAAAACERSSGSPAPDRTAGASSERIAADAAVATLDAAAPAHRTFPDLAAALAAVIGDDVRVVGFGELHQRTDRPGDARSTLARFTEALPAFAGRTSDLVLETWRLDPACTETAAEATVKVETTMQRPASTKTDIGALIDALRGAAVQPHIMRLACDDWARIAPPGADIDYEVMLSIITRELGRIAASAALHRDREGSPRRLVAIYGGALHNDLYPNPGVEEWSFAAAVDRATAGGYLEIDLYVPELVEHDVLARQEAWFPLVARARPDQVIVAERGPRSYVVLLSRGRAPAAGPGAVEPGAR